MWITLYRVGGLAAASMKVPPKRKGNARNADQAQEGEKASMKVPPKRKGNAVVLQVLLLNRSGLNESPSEKEGKFDGAA